MHGGGKVGTVRDRAGQCHGRSVTCVERGRANIGWQVIAAYLG